MTVRNRTVAPPATVAEVVARVEQGEPVTPLDLVAAEGAERLVAITEAVERKRAAEAQREADAAERERLLAEYAAEADVLNVRMIHAVDRLHATADEVVAVRDEIDRTIAAFHGALRGVGLVLDRYMIDVQTDGRVILSPDQLGTTTIKVPASLDYGRWVTALEAQRAAS